MLRYFRTQLKKHDVTVKLNTYVSAAELIPANYDQLILATGIKPRRLELKGIDHPSVLSYLDVLQGAEVGKRVAIIGAGGIGFDVAEYLSHQAGENFSTDIPTFMEKWGIDMQLRARGGVANVTPAATTSPRQITLLQRKKSKVGAKLGKTTGWIHRHDLKIKNVQMLAGCEYHKIDDEGLHINVAGEPQIIPVDNIVICAGQLSQIEIWKTRCSTPPLIG